MNKPRFSRKFRDSCRTVASCCYGRKGVWAYEAFLFINATYFNGRLPHPLILWSLTAHGKCVAWARTTRDKSRPPIINLHPALLRGSERDDPWGIPARWLGPSLVFDTLLHECIHIHIDANLPGHDGRTAHDGPRWMRQVNRIAPLLGFSPDIHMGVTRTARVADPDAPPTSRGKCPTRVQRISTGNVPLSVAAGFPTSLRCYLRQADAWYAGKQLPEGAPSL